MTLLFFEFVILSLVIVEYLSKKNAISPFLLLAGIYLFALPLINVIGVEIDFLPVLDTTILYFALFLFIFSLPGLLISMDRYYIKKSIVKISKQLKLKRRIIWYIYLFSLVCYMYNLFQVVRIYGFEGTKSHAFGVFAHIGFLSRCLFPIVLYYFFETKKLKYLIAILINVVGFILFQGKYHMYITVSSFIVVFLFLRNVSVKKLIKYVVVIFLSAILLFVSVYTIIPNIIAGDTSSTDMISGLKASFRHFFHYFFCPFITSNEYFDNPAYNGVFNGLLVNFNPLDVLYEQFFGNRNFYSPVITLWPKVENSGLTANVGGIFSESVLNLGFFGAVIYTIFISSIVYYFYIKLIKNGEFLITTSLLIGMIMMCFFCNYFSLLPNLECFVYSFLLDLFLFNDNLRYNFFKYRGLK